MISKFSFHSKPNCTAAAKDSSLLSHSFQYSKPQRRYTHTSQKNRSASIHHAATGAYLTWVCLFCLYGSLCTSNMFVLLAYALRLESFMSCNCGTKTLKAWVKLLDYFFFFTSQLGVKKITSQPGLC